VHLSSQERRLAQEQTARWRREARLSQPEIAEELLVGHSTYRQWETGTGGHDGPTRRHAEDLDQLLRRRLGTGYQAGEVLRIWGWPETSDLSFARLTGLLGRAGFEMPSTTGSPPSTVLWVHRLQNPNLLHAVFSLAAAAATRGGCAVLLLLDDMALPARERPGTRVALETRIRSWYGYAGGRDGNLSVRMYSEVLTERLLAERGWRTVSDYLGSDTEVLQLLLASKVISPMQFSTDSEQSVLEVLRQAGSLKVGLLLTALRNWMVFEDQVEGLLATAPADDSMPVVTLGGEDEHHLWDLWHHCCSDELTSRVQHIYLRPMPMPSYLAVWQVPALAARTTRPMLTDYLRGRTQSDRNTDLMEWIVKAAIYLPADLNAEYHASLDPAIMDINALLRRPTDDLPAISAAVAKAVVEWLNP
jgi:transcriptional regulator with XRE-family HTH domain